MSQQAIGISNQQDNLNQYTIELDTSLNLDQVIGQDETIKRLRTIANQINYARIYEFWGSKPPKGIIFFGQSGCGKSFTVKCFAAEVNATIMELRYQDIASHYVDKPLELLKQIKLQTQFESMKKKTILLIDEIDAFLPSRGLSDIHESDRKRVNFFLNWMDGGLKEQDNIIFIGTTNRLDILDPAALRSGRFSELLEFKPLDKQNVIKCLESHIKRREQKAGKCFFKKINWNKIETQVETITGADVNYIIDIVLTEKAKEHQQKILGIIKGLDNELLEINFEKVAENVIQQNETIPNLIDTDHLIKAIQIFKTSRIDKKTNPIGFINAEVK